MTKKREPKKPKVVWVGSTPITPITDKESRKIDKRIRKRREKLRQRYPEVHGKVVDYMVSVYGHGHALKITVRRSTNPHLKQDLIQAAKQIFAKLQ